MHPALMFTQEVRALYTAVLLDRSGAVGLKVQVLKNLQSYLQEEDSRMLEADRDCETCLPVPFVWIAVVVSVDELYMNSTLFIVIRSDVPTSMPHFAICYVILWFSITS